MLPRLMILIAAVLPVSIVAGVAAAGDWPYPGAAPGGGHYSDADQITPGNVDRLEIAWTHRSGDFRAGANFIDGLDGETPLQSSWQATPILVDDHLVICTPYNRIIAVDARTGVERWSYAPDIDLADYPMPRCRGVTQWRPQRSGSGAGCEIQVIVPLMDARIIALDARSGDRCPFGDTPEINLREGLGDHTPADYMLNTPPAILGDTLITGAAVADNMTTEVPSGVVRAFDLNSGALRWAWEPLPESGAASPEDDGGAPAQAAGDTRYQRGTTNVWSFISVDQALGLVYVPTGNMSPDYYGGHRGGRDEYSSSVVALRVDSGEVAWHFRTVNHDIWDFDVPSQPTLYDLETPSGPLRALAQTTKQGYVYLLNRETGEPLFGIIDQPVPQGAAPGDYTAATQPIPARPRSLFRFRDDYDEAWGLIFWDRNACADVLAKLRYEGEFTPPSLQGSLHLPSAFGGHNWGGPAVDPRRGKLIVNTQHVGTVVQLIPRDQCAPGKGPAPVADGPFLTEPSEGTPYCNRRWLGFVSPLGVPCTPPPWGTLAAIDLASGAVDWQVPLGTTRDMAPFPFWFIDGVPNIGGPVVTATGLVFIAATTDHYLRAFATETGEELWRGRLPTSAHGLPITYQVDDGDQYVVVAAGGHAALGTPPGDYLIAFKLAE